jgi:hypothetical protein
VWTDRRSAGPLVRLNAGGCVKPELKEHDAMICRACGREERASEGYPCEICGTFICIVCTNQGVVRCRECQEK